VIEDGEHNLPVSYDLPSSYLSVVREDSIKVRCRFPLSLLLLLLLVIRFSLL
jgi:hypothetical protein